MTRQDFILIAEEILTAPLTVKSANGYISKDSDSKLLREKLAEHFANRLATTNPNFKRELFIQAATGVVAVTARKAV